MFQVIYLNLERPKFAARDFPICCSRNIIDGLIKIEAKCYKTLLFLLQDKHIGCTVFAIQCPVFVSIKYGQPIYESLERNVSQRSYYFSYHLETSKLEVKGTKHEI